MHNHSMMAARDTEGTYTEQVEESRPAETLRLHLLRMWLELSPATSVDVVLGLA